MILLAIPAGILTLMSLAAFAGEWVWWLDVMANFRAQYVVALLALGSILLVAPRWRRLAYVVLLVGLVNMALVAPLFLDSPDQGSSTPSAVKILSFNLLSSNEQYGQVIEFIRSTDADLVFLHEASRPWEVAIESAGLDYEVVRGRSDDLIFGTLVLARDELDAVTYGFAESQPRAIALTYQPDDWPEAINVLSIHPLAPTNEERAALRNAQIGFAADWVDATDGRSVVLGDFNATPWSAPFRELVGRTRLHNSQRGYGLQPTFPTSSFFLLRVPIDHLLHSDGIAVRDRRLGASLGSDHFPLIVELAFQP